MKSAALISLLPNLFDLVANTLVEAGGTRSEVSSVAQIVDDQRRMLTVFGDLGKSYEDDWRSGPDDARGIATPPNLYADGTAVEIECRWESMFSEWMARIAEALPEPAWVMDSNGAIWPASDVDPDRVVL